MTRTILRGASLAAVLTLLLAVPALAGGWAEVRLDATGAADGEDGTSVIGFTLLQHGVTPVDWGNVTVTATDADGTALTAVAEADGGAGHWTVALALEAGTYELAVAHRELEVTPVGDMHVTSVGAVPNGTPGSSVGAAGSFPALVVVLLAFAVAVPLLGGAMLLARARVPSGA